VLSRAPRPAPAAPAATGALLIEARPWAEVVEVTRAGGGAVELPAERSTPLRLELPAGRYAVVLRHPGAAETRRLEIDLRAGVGSQRVESVFLADAAFRFLAEVLP
jgi:hypothetical protein